ncbi:PREDICTED: UPF0481 protein At3g47200-like [Fragaria vesca subsp. vesca]|uniref:UPF0481 protein At3g47200-like n=1 Tax=Fragaria vesca subsp. vesca TaxID=101020 RepID=UPI0002C2FB4B|nr:PREDICTED: UPF0481 protein At3g47200-like [Fragaria vesca subsp. vesca]
MSTENDTEVIVIVNDGAAPNDTENASAPNDTENASIPLETSIREKLQKLPPLSPSCFIYRVPERFWLRNNPKIYTPEVVSIGPLHHGRETLQDMEEHKYRYLQQFLDRTEENFLECYIQKIRDQEADLRSYYAENIKFCSDDFVTIMLVDAAFIIELFLNYYFNIDDSTDRIMSAPFLINDISSDLLLLENQLPFFILEDLFGLEEVNRNSNSGVNGEVSFIQLFCKFFEQELGAVGADCNLETVNFSEVEGAHFLDIIRNLCMPRQPLVRCTRNEGTPIAPSITELHQAGVKFEVGSTRHLFGIRFNNGILQIPKIEISACMADTLRNIAVFEQCHYLNSRITDYLDLMNCFVNTAKDVELLAEYGIVTNYLADNSEACSLINNLGKGFRWDPKDFCFTPLYEDLHRHCKKPWNKWKANLRQNYLNTPWAVVSVVAAVFLIILTLTQTVCALISL